jgi:hypothetical protein
MQREKFFKLVHDEKMMTIISGGTLSRSALLFSLNCMHLGPSLWCLHYSLLENPFFLNEWQPNSCPTFWPIKIIINDPGKS